MTIKKYIENKEKDKFFMNGLKVVVKDAPPSNISVNRVIEKLLRKVPSKLLIGLRMITVGIFEELVNFERQAMYKNSTIFVTNDQESDEDMLDDIIHEVAHLVEEKHNIKIYGDGLLEREFLKKRDLMHKSLSKDNIRKDYSFFMKTGYDIEFDYFLHKDVGYEKLRNYTSSLFYSPYGSTSLSEYFANGFEAFFMKEDILRLKRLSPMLFDRLTNLMEK